MPFKHDKAIVKLEVRQNEIADSLNGKNAEISKLQQEVATLTAESTELEAAIVDLKTFTAVSE